MLRRAGRAGAWAAAVSGAPSTAWALLTGEDPLAATRAAATLVPGGRRHPLAGGAVAHVGVSAVWTAAFALVASRHPRVGVVRGAVAGGLAGVAIAVLDLRVVAPRASPAVATLPFGPQLADHVLFGAVLGGLLTNERVFV